MCPPDTTRGPHNSSTFLPVPSILWSSSLCHPTWIPLAEVAVGWLVIWSLLCHIAAYPAVLGLLPCVLDLTLAVLRLLPCVLDLTRVKLSLPNSPLAQSLSKEPCDPSCSMRVFCSAYTAITVLICDFSFFINKRTFACFTTIIIIIIIVNNSTIIFRALDDYPNREGTTYSRRYFRVVLPKGP